MEKKCRFSHDLETVRRVAKINLYNDPRLLEADTIDKWDQSKLEEVVSSKSRPNETKIVCKYFLDAVENMKYGWLWECPNGKDCIYKHALPEGFVFKKEKDKKTNDDESGPSIEEAIEIERRKLDLSKCTPVTLERFLKWKEVKRQKKADEAEAARKQAAAKSGTKGLHVLSGRDLFIYDPSLFVDDEDAVENAEYEIRDEENDTPEQKAEDPGDEDEEVNGEKKEKMVDDDDDDDEETNKELEGDKFAEKKENSKEEKKKSKKKSKSKTKAKNEKEKMNSQGGKETNKGKETQADDTE